MSIKNKKILQNFLDEIMKISFGKGFSGFFYRNRVNVIICLLISISSKEDKEIGFEDLCSYIPGFITSRSTIKSVLDYAVKEKYFIKSKSLLDNRKSTYIPSSVTRVFLKKWTERNKEIFQD